MKLHHVGIAVTDLDQSIAFYSSFLKATCYGRESLPSFGVELCFFDVDGSRVELLTPISPDCAVQKFLTKNGPGLHHLCYEVENIELTLRELENQGCQLIDQHARQGAHGMTVAFVHPQAFSGVLVELCQLTIP